MCTHVGNSLLQSGEGITVRIKPGYSIIAGVLLVVAALTVSCSAQDNATPTGTSEDGSEVRPNEETDATIEYRVDEVDGGVTIEVTGVGPDRQSEVLDAFDGCQEGG